MSLALEVQVARGRLERDPEAAAPSSTASVPSCPTHRPSCASSRAGSIRPFLTERGLLPAIKALAGRAPVPVEIRGEPIERLSPTLEITAYFTVSEALTNVAKYARATHADVRVAQEDGALVIEVRDDGVGGARAGIGSGLSGLADRVGACDGTLSITSPPGEGTLVRALLPVG